MFRNVEVPLWLLVLIVAFAAASFLAHFLVPSVRWFFRRRAERLVARLNRRLKVPIRPFKLARRHDMIQRLIHDPEVMAAVVEHARSQGVPEAVALEEARRHAREIVPGFSANLYYGLGLRLARWISTLLYRVRVGHLDEPALDAIDSEDTVVFVMNHRSNMDYVLVTWLAGGRSALAYAVGEWANVWPMNTLVRSMGAYFIRRRGLSPLHRRVLARFIRLATDAGTAQAVFPEGGLSLDGRIQPPRLGLFKYLLEGRGEDAPHITFVPVALNYDRVLEDRVLIEAARRGERRFRARLPVLARFTARVLWRMLTGRFRRFGTAAVVFGRPLRLDALPAGAEPGALAEAVMARVAEAVPLTPVPVAAHLLLTEGEMPMASFHARFADLVNEAAASDRLPPDWPLAPEDDARRALDILERRGLVRRRDGRIAPVPEEEPLLRFYGTSIAHRLQPPAGAACPQVGRS